MTQVQTFNLGFGPTSREAPVLPAPLKPDEFHTRQEIRDHQDAQQRYYNYQRQVENQARIDADNQRAKDLANAQREQTDFEYDEMKRTQWQAARDKEAARLQKEKDDAMARTAYLLSSPPVADLTHRSEYAFLKDFEFWVGQRGYTLEPEGLQFFQPGFYSIQLTAPVVTKKASAK
jgi:hypothetical protein